MNTDDDHKWEDCPLCQGRGEFSVECCSGGGGCSCGGEPVAMCCCGCDGAGVVDKTIGVDSSANLKSLEGRCFLGSGPRNGWLMYR